MQPSALTITSPAFRNGEMIPSKYTCEGEEINPPIEIKGLPEGTQSLALIVEDPDAPKGTYDHWVVWNIDPSRTRIKENSIPGINGHNSSGKTGYHGPCPPSGAHRYFFHVYALNANLDLAPGSDKKQLQEAMLPHILAQGSLMGKYQRSN